MLTSRNKRSIAIDLAQTAGQELLKKLIDGADVFIVNYFDDQLERFGIDYASARERNPRPDLCPTVCLWQSGSRSGQAWLSIPPAGGRARA